MKIEVWRAPDNGLQTLGDLFVIDEAGKQIFKCESLELPWKNNERKVSCIRKDTYLWSKVPATTNIPYEHIAIHNVVARDGICIHKANYVTQLRGCIAVGDKEMDINGDGQIDITASGKTFDALMKILPPTGEITIH